MPPNRTADDACPETVEREKTGLRRDAPTTAPLFGAFSHASRAGNEYAQRQPKTRQEAAEVLSITPRNTRRKKSLTA